MVTRHAWVALPVALLAAVGVVSCSQILGIEDRSLRAEDSGEDTLSRDGNVVDDANDETSIDASAETGTPDATADAEDAPVEPAFAAFSAVSVDFGRVSCGTGAPANRTLTITNTGGKPLDWSATLPATPTFSITGASAGTIPGGSFATITIASSGVPAFATAGTTDDVDLTVTIAIPGLPAVSRDFALLQTAAGAAFTVTPGTVDFGQVQVGTQATSIPVDVRNTGNVPMTIGFTAPTNAQFSLLSDAGTILNPDASVTGLTARFVPSSTTLSNASAGIMASSIAMCGISPSVIQMTGQGTSGPVTVQPGALDFGLIDCGATATAKQVTLMNSGAPFPWSASLAKGGASPYTISPSSGVAITGTPVVITVTPKAVPAASAITPDLYGDTLTINAVDGPHAVTLHETAQGALLSQSVTSVAFGGVNVGSTATSLLTVTNNGNASAAVSFTTVNGVFVVTPQGQTVGGAGDTSPTTVSFSPTSASVFNGSTQVTVPPGTALCAALPPAVPLNGTGTQSLASVKPNTLDFGLVNCGSTAPLRSVVIDNAGQAGQDPAFNWTAVLSKGASSPFTLQQSSGSLAPTKSFKLNVSPVRVPQTSPVTPDFYSDTLTITTNAPNDTPHVVSLHETARGVILALSPSPIAFGSVAGGASSALPFQITNSGNVPAAVSLALSAGTGVYFSVAPTGQTTVNGGTTVSGTATFHPPSGPVGAKSSVVTPTFPEVNCGGPVTGITLNGSGS